MSAHDDYLDEPVPGHVALLSNFDPANPFGVDLDNYPVHDALGPKHGVTGPGAKNAGNTREKLTGSPVAPGAPDGLGGGTDAPEHAEFLACLDAVRAHLARYVMTSTEDDLDMLALWIVHTHLAAETFMTPRLLLTSPVPESGKTTVLEHIEHLAFDPSQMSSISSDALLPRMLDAGMRTFLIDEADRTLAEDNPKTQQVLAIINSGYKVGGRRPVNVPDGKGGWVAKEMPTYSPVAMAGNGPKLPADTLSRTITVILMPAGEGEVEETDWELLEPDLDLLCERLKQAADGVREYVRTHRPPMPKGCFNRRREKWQPLKRVAAAASKAWAEKVDALVRRELEEADADREAGLGKEGRHVTLARDLSVCFSHFPDSEFLPTDTLIQMLQDVNPSYWGEHTVYGPDGGTARALTAKGLGYMLRNHYGIRAGRLPGRGAQRGYYRQAFLRTWRALRIPAPGDDSTPAQMRLPPPKAPGASGASGVPVSSRPGNTRKSPSGPVAGGLFYDPTSGLCLRYGCAEPATPDTKHCPDHAPLTESEPPA